MLLTLLTHMYYSNVLCKFMKLEDMVEFIAL